MMIFVPLHQSKFILFLFFFLIKTLNAQPTYLLTTCSNPDSYTANSLYKSNLDSLISVFISQSSNRGFYSYSSGSSSTTTVYGTYLCRGDISVSTCETCISRASKNVFIFCPVQKKAIIWYEECFFRYSNRPILSILDQREGVTWTNYDTMIYQSYFISTVKSRMDGLIREAYSSSSYFAKETYHVNYLGEVYDLYGLVQCTPDLDQYDCYRCLKSAFNETDNCCYGKRFALVYYANCILTYKAISVVSPPPPPPPPPPRRFFSGDDSPSSDGSFSFKFKGKWFRRVIAPVIAVVVMILAICFCSLCCCCIKKKNKQNESETSIELSTATNIVHENRTIDDQSMAKTESHIPN